MLLLMIIVTKGISHRTKRVVPQRSMARGETRSPKPKNLRSRDCDLEHTFNVESSLLSATIL